jgi:hypothetical protein
MKVADTKTKKREECVDYCSLATAARRGSKKEGSAESKEGKANLGGDRAPGIEPETAPKRGVQLHQRP